MTAAQRREQLLEVTATLVGEHGFHDVSIEVVARSASVTRATVYQHFADLHSLLEAVIDRETARALVQVSETTLPDLNEGDPQQLMLDSLHAYLHAVHNQPNTWRLILMPPEGAPSALHESIADGRALVLACLTEAVRPAESLDAESPDAEMTARLLSAISDEYARLLLTDPARFPPERLLRHAHWWLSLGAGTSTPGPDPTSVLPSSADGRVGPRR
jgi:AcrR family transcriptional regulator